MQVRNRQLNSIYDSRSGQLGLGDTDSRVWPSNVKALQQQMVTYAACGEKHSVVVTLEGGVFSFGSSANGQLGHNSRNDELLPRKIVELMSCVVSQIACGRYRSMLVSSNAILVLLRSYTVIYIPKDGQIFTFGLACTGGAETKLDTFTTIPQKLSIPFLPYKTMKHVGGTRTLAEDHT